METLSEKVERLEAEVAYYKGLVRALTGIDYGSIQGLTKLESAIVNVLRNARGRVVSVQAVCEACEFERFNASEGSIKTYVHRLRLKGYKIGTVRGYGYRWEGELTEAQASPPPPSERTS